MNNYRPKKVKFRQQGGCKPASDITIRDGNGNITKIISKHTASKAHQLCNDLKKNATPAEIKLFKALLKIAEQYNFKPYFQYPLYTNKSFFILDIYIPKARLAIEVDGQHHLYDKKQVNHDTLRDKLIRERSIEILRFQNIEVYKDVKSVVNSITGMIKLRLSGASREQHIKAVCGRPATSNESKLSSN